MPRLLAQKTLICSISSDLCSLLSRYSQNTPDMLKVFQFILHRFSFERFLKIVFKLGIKMKVCFAVDGTAISEGAFDCKYYLKFMIGPDKLLCLARSIVVVRLRRMWILALVLGRPFFRELTSLEVSFSCQFLSATSPSKTISKVYVLGRPSTVQRISL